MFQNIKQIEESLLEADFPADTARSMATCAKPCIWLETKIAKHENEIPIGSTKIGGRPDLPANVGWPIRDAYQDAAARISDTMEAIARLRNADQSELQEFSPAHQDIEETCNGMLHQVLRTANRCPLTFIAQINFAQLRSIGQIDPEIPDHGLLSLFYDVDQQPWGFRPSDSIGSAIMFSTSSPAGLARTDAPAELVDSDCGCWFRPLVCIGHAAFAPAPPFDANCAHEFQDQLSAFRYRNWFDDLKSDPRCGHWHEHRVGGHPRQIQGNMQRECQLVSHGISWRGEMSPTEKTLAASLEGGAKDWLMLLQIATDDKSDMMWGDAGNLYVWINRKDLKAKRFEKARVILQCY